jgi:chemotaxis protein MotB
MSEARNPFTDPAAQANRAAGHSRIAWIVAGLLAALLLLVAYLWTAARVQLREAEPLNYKLNQAEASLTNALAESQKDKNQIEALRAQIANLEKEKESGNQREKALEDEMRTNLESKDVTISNLQGRLTVNILDRVMFDSAEAVLRPEGEAVLRQIATVLAAHPELKIQVIGHTDNVPIHTRFPSNWELSTARALAAVHFLTEKAGVDPRRVGVVGYGEYRPLADNSTAEGRAKNRRIAITILPDELAKADAAPP